MAFITEVVTTGSQATVSFPSIPGTYESLNLVLVCRGTAASNEVNLRMQFNGDTGTNYNWVGKNRFGDVTGTASAFIRCGSMPGSTAVANTPAAGEIYIPGYARTLFNKASTFAEGQSGSATADTYFNFDFGTWLSTAAITSILLFPASGNFVDGSSFALYGM